MKLSLAGIVIVWIIAFSNPIVTSVAQAKSWAVVVQDQTRPAQVGVILLGTQLPPWRVDSVWHNNVNAAWKKACWLVRNGDIYGHRYHSSDMNEGRVNCDMNCNCHF